MSISRTLLLAAILGALTTAQAEAQLLGQGSGYSPVFGGTPNSPITPSSRYRSYYPITPSSTYRITPRRITPRRPAPKRLVRVWSTTTFDYSSALRIQSSLYRQKYALVKIRSRLVSTYPRNRYVYDVFAHDWR